MMRLLTKGTASFSTITHLRGKSQRVNSKDVKLRGIHIKSTMHDSPTMIFFPEIFDQAENWLSFFTNPLNKVLFYAQRRSLRIGMCISSIQGILVILINRTHSDGKMLQVHHHIIVGDVSRFMYEQKITMATLGGHGIGAKVALAAACYHFERTTGYFALDSTPTNQYYHQSYRELRKYLQYLKELNIKRSYNSISHDLKQNILCPKWRSIFQSSLIKAEGGYNWNFNLDVVSHNLLTPRESNLLGWQTLTGLFPGRGCFIFPQYSRYVHLATNTLPMYKVVPRLEGLNSDIWSIQGDENPLNHWLYEHPADINPYASRLSNWLTNYDGVHVLLKNRAEVGNTFVPDQNNRRIPREDFPSDRIPAHYHHNWRFNNVYEKK